MFEDIEPVKKPGLQPPYIGCSDQAPIEISPASQVVEKGGTLILSFSVKGAANRYQWFKDGVVVSEISDAPEYKKENFSEADAGAYTCKIQSGIVHSLVLTTTPIVVQFAYK